MRSFGTEDRDTPYPIAPQPTVYDYILFRGSDIKDIRVVNSVPIPNDPAIMQLQLPPNQMGQQPPPQGFPPQNFPMQQQQGGIGPFGSFGQLQGPPPQIGAQMGLGGSNIPQQQQQQPSQQQQAQSLSPNQLQHQSQSNQGNTIGNLVPSGGHTKKSSELSKTEKPTSQTANVQSTALRKHSNKSQGVQKI